MTDRDDLLATMYDDDIPPPRPIDHDPHVKRIRVGVIEYEVPTVAYVMHLEQLVAQQQHMLDLQRRAITRIETMLHGTRSYVRRYGDAIGDLRTDLARKVDHS